MAKSSLKHFPICIAIGAICVTVMLFYTGSVAFNSRMSLDLPFYLVYTFSRKYSNISLSTEGTNNQFRFNNYRELLIDDQTSSKSSLKCSKHLQCSTDKLAKGLPQCNMQSLDYTRGSWIKALNVPNDYGLNWSSWRKSEWLTNNAYEYQNRCNLASWKCHITEPNECRVKSIRTVAYQWIPDNCKLRSFDAAEVDRAISGKSVLFIGDSLMRQMFNSWRVLMEPVWKDRTEATSPNPERFLTKSGTMYRYFWSKFMVNEDALTNQGVLRLSGSEWDLYIRENHVDFIIFNVGHHWHKNDKNFSKYTDMVKLVMGHMQTYFNGTSIMFRTSTPGHYNCNKDKKLRQGPIDYTPELNENYDPFNWRKPVEYDYRWLDIARELSFEHKFQYLNVSALTSYRPDAHAEWNIRNTRMNIDCLHWCLPGVPDFWNQMFMNAMIERL